MVQIMDFYKKYEKKIKRLMNSKGFKRKLAKQVYEFSWFMKRQADNIMIDLYAEMLWYQFFPEFQRSENIERLYRKSQQFEYIIDNDIALENSMYGDMDSNYQMASGIVMEWIDRYYDPKSIMDRIPTRRPIDYSVDYISDKFAIESFIKEYKKED